MSSANSNPRSSEGSYAVCSAFRSKILLFLTLIFALILCMGCDLEERHRILTFFFDGVPPLYEEETIEIQDPNSTSTRRKRPEVVWYIHEPQKDCVTCHGEKREGRTFSSEVTLTAEVPELCFGCHEEQRSSGKRYVHGPVAVAQCLVCHDPHKSKNEHILKYPVPKLCYSCHEAEWTNMVVANHELEEYEQCLDCHSAHESDHKNLLKEDWESRIIPETEEPADGKKGDEVTDPNSIEVIVKR